MWRQVLRVPLAALLALCLPAQEPPPNEPSRVIEFDSNGLHYFTLTRDGLTVMFAHLPQQVREYGVIEVSISNGSNEPITVKPEDFRFRRQDRTEVTATPARTVVEQFLRTGNRNDVIKLVSAYEAALYGFQNPKATSGYEQRRVQAMADLTSAKVASAAAASALVFIPTVLKAGQSTDGAIFFPHGNRALGAGHMLLTIGRRVFEFETVAPEILP
jgi:hypothetical protein